MHSCRVIGFSSNVLQMFLQMQIHFKGNSFSPTGRLLRSAQPTIVIESNRDLTWSSMPPVAENKSLKVEIKRLKGENGKMKDSLKYYKRKASDLAETVKNLNIVINELKEKFSFSDEILTSLTKSAASIPVELFKETSKRTCPEKSMTFLWGLFCIYLEIGLDS